MVVTNQCRSLHRCHAMQDTVRTAMPSRTVGEPLIGTDDLLCWKSTILPASCLTTETMRLCPSSGFPKPVGSGNSRVYHHAVGDPHTHINGCQTVTCMHRHMAFATSTYLVFCDCSLSPRIVRASCRKRRRVSRETHHRYGCDGTLTGSDHL